jgi:anti-sigma factor RsiW
MSSGLHRERFRRDHRWAPNRMSDYLDGKLGADGRARMEGHLRECEECRRLIAGLRRTLAALQRAGVPADGVDPLRVATLVRGRLGEPK